MKIKTQDYENFTVLELQGEFDSDSADQFQSSVTDIIAKHNAGIALNMTEVKFIDSLGLERLLWARDYCSENNCQFRLAGLSENCKKILEITRLESEFDCYPQLEEAVKSFA
jgi:anti-sigma B factor antagonist